MMKVFLILVLWSMAILAGDVIANIEIPGGKEYAIQCDDNTTVLIQEKSGMFIYEGNSSFSLSDAVNSSCRE